MNRHNPHRWVNFRPAPTPVKRSFDTEAECTANLRQLIENKLAGHMVDSVNRTGTDAILCQPMQIDAPYTSADNWAYRQQKFAQLRAAVNGDNVLKDYVK